MWFFIFDFLIIALHCLFGKNHFFNLDFEYNLPNIYRALKFLLASFLAFLIFRKNKKLWWLIAALLLWLLALDDGLAIHEKYGSIIFYNFFSQTSLADFYSDRLAGFSWYPIYFLPVGIGFVFLFYFWRKKLRFHTTVAKYFFFGIICLVLAFILEPIGSVLWPYQKIYQIEVILEEGLELLSSSFFLASLYLAYKKL